MEGTVIVTREGTFLDDGTVRFLVSGSLPHGHEVRVSGVRSGERITVSSSEDLKKDAAKVPTIAARDSGRHPMTPDNTFTLHGREDI